MGDFKWRHFREEIILWAVRWYCKYGISYRELEEIRTSDFRDGQVELGDKAAGFGEALRVTHEVYSQDFGWP